MTQTTQDLDDELIKLTYCLPLEPQRILDLIELVDTSVADTVSDAGQDRVFFEKLKTHFEMALNLLERRAVAEPVKSAIQRQVDMDSQPAMLIDSTGRIRYANHAAFQTFGVDEGSLLPDQLLLPDDYRALIFELRSIAAAQDGRFRGVFDLIARDGENAPKMVLSRATNLEGEILGYLASVRTRWQPHIGRVFARTFKLTQAETMILEGIVETRPLDEVAERRSTSLGTVRNQLKRMMSRLEIKSQAELLALYAGFAQIAEAPTALELSVDSVTPLQNRAHLFERSSGGQLEIETFGLPGKRPVLFFHPIIGGTFLSAKQRNLISREDIFFVMPLLPGFKGSSQVLVNSEGIEPYCRDLLAALDEFDIDTFDIISVNTSFIYALQVAKLAGERAGQIVSCNGALPFEGKDRFKGVSAQHRAPYYVARYVPSLMRLYMRSVMAKLEAGYDEVYVRDYLKASALDVSSILTPEVKAIAKASIKRAFANGPDSVIQELMLSVSPWGELLRETRTPISMLIGDEDTEYPYENALCVFRNRPQTTVRKIEKAGTLLWFQRPAEVFQSLKCMPDGSGAKP